MILAGSGVSIGLVPGVILAVLGIISLLAAALAVARASFAKAQIEQLRGANQDLRDSNEDQEKKIVNLESDLTLTNEKLASEVRARQALEKVVTGRVELGEIKTMLGQILERLPL